ncbi:MAG: hypothetical protein HC898_10025, partial [Phycisphaerales bacterium]|nr:hypothetical protein [Phycisphaerales bacterium]
MFAFLACSWDGYFVDFGCRRSGMSFGPPVIETRVTTRHAPWWVIFHLGNVNTVKDQLRPGDGSQNQMAIGISPHDHNLMLLGTDLAGAYRTTDGGKNWFNNDQGLALLGTLGYGFDPVNPNIVYCVNQSIPGSMPFIPANKFEGIYKSTDAGLTWKQVLNVKNIRKRQHDIRFDKSGAVYVLGQSGVFKSSDGGANWQNLGLADLTKQALHVGANGEWLLTASEEQGIHYSADGGKTWQLRNQGLGEIKPYCYVTIHPQKPDTWFCVAGNKLYRSDDRGMNWVEQTGAIPGKQMCKLMFGAANPAGEPVLYLVYRAVGSPL